MIFKYKAFDKNGKKIVSKIEASTLEEAKEKLSDLIIIDIKQAFSLNFNFTFSKKVPSSQLSRLFSTIGLYLKSSINILDAIRLTLSAQEDKRIIKFLDYLQREINEGKSFSMILKSQNIIYLPPFALSAIIVGEESGKLDIVLLEIAEYLKNQDKIESKSTQALMYPMFIIIISIFMIGFMLNSVVPKIVKVFQNLNQDLPPITKFVISAGNFVQNNWEILFILFIFIILLFSMSYKKISKFKYFVDLFLLKIPIIKKIIISKELGRFSYFIFILTNSGVTFLNAINLSVNSIQNEVLKKIFKKALNEVLEGKKLSVSLNKVGFNYDKSFIQALSLAEETSEVVTIMKNVSEIYLEENEMRTNLFLSLLEPLLIVVVGGIIGFIVTALLLPIFSMNMIK